MINNYCSIYQTLGNHLQRYERERSGQDETPWETMLNSSQA